MQCCICTDVGSGKHSFKLVIRRTAHFDDHLTADGQTLMSRSQELGRDTYAELKFIVSLRQRTHTPWQALMIIVSAGTTECMFSNLRVRECLTQ